MTTIADLDRERRRDRAIEYQRACRLGDVAACRRIAAQHRAETDAARGPSVSEVRVVARTIARTHGPAEGSEPA